MSRPIKTIKLSNGTDVDIITYLTWGEKQDLEDILISGISVSNTGIGDVKTNVIREGKYKLLEIGIKEIRTKEGKQEFTKEWIDNLNSNDGELIYDELDKLDKKKQDSKT